jgi:hypothetical protein
LIELFVTKFCDRRNVKNYRGHIFGEDNWNLEFNFSEALEKAGAIVKKHKDYFPPEALDVDWLMEVSKLDWVVLTKDKKIGSRPLEVDAIARAGVKVFILVSGDLSSQQMADVFANSLEKLKGIAKGNKAPFIAKIYKSGKVVLWKNRTQLLKILKL